MFRYLYLILVMILFVPVLSAKVIESSDIAHIISYSDQDTLVLLDIDNTVIQLTQSLGTPQWFSDFYKKKRSMGISHEIATAETLHIYLKVNELSNSKPVDLRTSAIIQKLQEQGIIVLALTSRDDKLFKTTLRHLKPTKLNFNLGKFKDYQLKLKVGEKSKVQNGIIFAGGKHKGACLEEFFSMVNWMPKRVIFVDDQLKAIQEVESSILKSDIDYIGVRYGYLDKHVKSHNLKVSELQLEHFNKSGQIMSDEAALAVLKQRSD